MPFPKTTMHIYRVGQPVEFRPVSMSPEPGYLAIREAVLPILEGASDIEHVTVLHDGEHADMFVDELGAMPLTTRPPLAVNVAATEIYHAAMLSRRPHADTSDWPTIHGTAVLFSRRVWF